MNAFLALQAQEGGLHDLARLCQEAMSLTLATAVSLGEGDLVERLREKAEALEAAILGRSRQLSEALEQVQALYSVSQAQLERLKSFTEIAMRINRHAELGPLLDAVAEVASRLLRTHFSFIGLLDPDGSYRIIPGAGHWGLSEEFIAEFRTSPGRGLHHHALAGRDVMAVRDILDDPRSTNSVMRANAWRSELLAPLYASEVAIGILVVGERTVRDWTDDELEVMRFLAAQAASAIDRARSLNDLRELDRLKDEVLSIASHELRTPLTAIKGFAAILAADSGALTPDNARKYAQIIDVEADRMIRLVDDMLNVSRIEGGRMNLELHPVHLLEVVGRAVLASWGADTDHIEIAVDDHLDVLADTDSLLRILANLLENARKYSAAGARIAVRARNEGEDVEIRVWNEGEAFAPGEMELLFQKFSRLGRHRATGERGAGLGLYIARQLLLAMGGRLWAESTGDGPTFAFTLPSP